MIMIMTKNILLSSTIMGLIKDVVIYVKDN